MTRWTSVAGLLALAVVLSGCTYSRSGPYRLHYEDLQVVPPKKRAVTICHAYGCQKQTKIVFNNKQLKKIAGIMRKAKRRNSPFQERRAVAYAVAYMERHVGGVIGTKSDRPGMDIDGSGDPTQQDCVDEATNTTSYLAFLEANGLIKHHTVEHPFSKGKVLMGAKYWPHWTAVLKEKKSKQKYAVDSWIFKNGVNPAVIEVEKWYIKDLDSLPKSTS